MILVPSPNVAEDHQTKNARALESRGAALLIPDAEARGRLVDETLRLVNDKQKLSEMSRNIKTLALTDSDDKIVDEIVKILNQHD